ncbi:endonuclease III [Brevibacterium sp. JNUCC-42]|uniref:Endonuclease III n=1 Tax=Brevibacillus laterosporus TaxID=1465 RepID=A0A502IWW3_BRELA|nr:endonuclease III [Brevibacillus laterosporus]QOS97606.1 endonuclease III [Brevibacterium sp. JNUCC-42]QDX92651.1 endonuclease III [Brevibacillus laterosporus]RAP27799.1 Endonuclease III [Brevibacillus laterosporus]TPG70964.1 endonuclease III [Brevibacillus laterosporus]TPG90895.1 endonuclease III [Brevibacillus laterosporus]
MRRLSMKLFLQTLADMFPDAHCELTHSNAFELTIAVLLSAQCTDKKVNQVTEHLFQKYKTPEDYLKVSLEELQEDIRQIGLYKNKAKHIQALCRLLLEEYGGEVPDKHEELVKLPGVGRKTANVVVSVAFGIPAIAVDTHVERIAKRLGFCPQDASPVQVEEILMKKIPKKDWSDTHHRMIFFGRYHCKAQNPQCDICPLEDVCPTRKQALKIKKKAKVPSRKTS